MTRTIPWTLADRYRIEREIGAGGMATVYEAVDLRHDRRVAIKVMREDVTSGASAERFLREIRIVAQLTHPHVLPLIDSGEAAGVLFYVMPYVDGETLRARMTRAGELPVAECLWIMRHVLEGLAYAHARGVIHRDIKPENVLLSDRHALVADFGVAKALAGSRVTATTSMTTAVGTTLGTPAYMAPELIGGEAIDHRADLYALGVVAYEMLVGRLPFHANTPQQMMAAHLTSAVVPIQTYRPTIPPRLAHAVMRCLEKHPSDRWQGAGELLAHVETIAADGYGTPSPAVTMNQLVERKFSLSERVCRKLNRATLDPRVIGDSLTYVDNQVRSDVLVFFLHGLGLDHRDFEPVLERLPYRGLSPTLYGCEPDRLTRISLSLADHIVILREWLRDVVNRLKPSTVVMVGFSLGADMGFELLLAPIHDPAPRVDAFLSFDCNLSLDTCLVSRVLAGITPDRPDTLVADLQRLGSGATTLNEWLNIHGYLVKVLRKFQGDAGLLQRAAADIVRPLQETPGFDVFARWFKGARERGLVLRLVFSDAEVVRDSIARLKLENLDRGILGEEFRQHEVTVMPNADHFDLMASDRLLREVDEIVAATRARRT
jgi:serine/threonine protein kinase